MFLCLFYLLPVTPELQVVWAIAHGYGGAAGFPLHVLQYCWAHLADFFSSLGGWPGAINNYELSNDFFYLCGKVNYFMDVATVVNGIMGSECRSSEGCGPGSRWLCGYA